MPDDQTSENSLATRSLEKNVRKTRPPPACIGRTREQVDSTKSPCNPRLHTEHKTTYRPAGAAGLEPYGSRAKNRLEYRDAKRYHPLGFQQVVQDINSHPRAAFEALAL